MGVWNSNISLHRTNFLYFGMLFLLCLFSSGVLAQNSSVANMNHTSCPSGLQCYSSVRNVTVELGYNGKVCIGNTPQDCYGESDPRGFVPGPRQYPAILYQGDSLRVKSSTKYNFAFRLYNVSKSAFDSCNFQNASPVMPSLTREPFLINDIFVETTGIKYFIATSDNMIIQCQFGLKLEVNVRNRAGCQPSSSSNNEVCSSKGLCGVDDKFFTFNASCVCDTGYQGPYCGERNSCHAALNPCQNGATCIDKNSGLEDDYNCSCVPGYGGKNCEHDIQECESDPCLNGAVCIDAVNGYNCLCAPGFNGANCANLVPDKCESKPCQNGGTCERVGGNRLNYTCICPDGFTGRNCTENVTMSSSAVPYTSVMTTAVVGKSSVVSDVQTSTLGTTYTTLQTISHSSASAVEFSTSFATSSTSVVESMSTVSQSLVAPSPLSSPYLSLSSTFTLRLAPSINTINQSRTPSSSSSLVTKKTYSEVTSSTSSLSSSNTALSVSTVEGVQPSSVYDSSLINTTLMLSAAPTSVPSSAMSVMTTPSFTTRMISTSSLLEVEPSVTATRVTPSDAVSSSSLPRTSSVPSLSSSVQPSSSVSSLSSSLSSSSVPSTSLPSSSVSSSLSSSSVLSTSLPSLSVSSSSSSSVLSTSLPSLSVSSSVPSTSLPSSSVSSSLSSSSVPSTLPSVSSSSVPSSSVPSTSLLPSLSVSPSVSSSLSSSVPSTSLSSLSVSSSSSSVLSTSLPSSSGFSSSSSMPLSPQSSSSVSLSIMPSPSASSSSSLPPSTSSIGPTISSSSEVAPPSTSSQIQPSTPASSTVMSSSIYPTMPPPTTLPPVKEQTCQHKPCNNGTCLDVQDSVYGLNFTCRCPKPTYGPRCSTDFTLHFPRFSSSSYLVHKPIAFSNAGFNKIVITFKTTAANGLLFYSTHSRYKDFIQLYITGGKLEYRFDPGDYLCVIKSEVNVNTGNIVTAVVTYDGRNKQGSLQVDNNPKQVKTSLGGLSGIGLYDYWYIGGLPPGKSISGNGGQATPTFVGCIKDIELNGDQIKFTEATNWNDISECDTPCKGTHQPCQNNGQCIEDADDPHAYECNCTAGFEGKHCNSPSVCSGDPCKGGVCIMDKSVTNTSRVCLCPYGRGGIDCQDEFQINTPVFSMAYNYSSYIQYPVPTLSGPYFEISLQFKIEPNNTLAWENALMMFSGQNEYQGKGDDFFAVGINNSKVLLQYNLGSGIAYIESDPINTTHQWHRLTAARNGKEGYLYLDNQGVKRGSSPGQLVGLNLYTPVYIGGVRDFSELPTDVFFKRGFEGSIVNGGVKFGVTQPIIPLLTTQGSPSSDSQWSVVAGLNVRDENYNGCNTSQPCQNNGTCIQRGVVIVCSCVDGWQGMYCASRQIPCVNYNPCAVNSTCREVNNKAVCDCPLGKTGATCSDVISIQRPQFKDNSYMAFTRTALNIRSNTNIVIKFIPQNENGLLFYVAHKITSQKGDFLSVSLRNGYVQYRYDLGSGVDPKQSLQNITMNTEHTVTVTRDQQVGTLKVDNQAVISVRSPGSSVALDAGSNLYLGGVPQLSLVNPSAIADVQSLKDFVGCVTSVTVNGVPLKLTDTGAAEGRNIDNCQVSNTSDSNLA